MAKIPKPIFVCFGINELCQFWLFQRLPNFAAHFAMDSGSFYMLMFAKFGKNSQFSKNRNQNPQWNVIGSTIKTLRKFCHIWICWEWMIDVANFGNTIRLSDMECCAFIRHLMIEFVNNGKTLKLPKMECFSVQKSPHLATFGLAWSCQFLALKHTLCNGMLMHNICICILYSKC